ncbi:helix-turn-helix transcriptional regulator [Mycobacterium hubeiense]|uniref:helix-turn-helix transcriptional regulator n=1 Tax=Mycobacterium hubeiense TaxID=1867256 RepID=UPI0013043A6B|nr:helix-turn-helix transcriptional regulator [Mycobacterium sp. QGD 101]
MTGTRSLAEVGRLVAERRTRQELDQIGLARAARVDPKTVRSLENGTRWPRDSTRIRIENALGWDAGSIARLRSGGEPVEAGAKGRTPVLTSRRYTEPRSAVDGLTSAATAMIDVLHSMDELSDQLPESERAKLEHVRRQSLYAVAHMLSTNCELVGESLAAEEIDPLEISNADALEGFVRRLGGHLGLLTTIYDVAVQILDAVSTGAETEKPREVAIHRPWPKAPPPDLTALDAAAQRGEKRSDRDASRDE